MTAKEIEELKRLVENLTAAVNSLALQIALLNQERVADHTMLLKHDNILLGTFEEPGLIDITRDARNTLSDLVSIAKKLAWIIATPIVTAIAIITVVAVASYFGVHK